MRSSIVFAAAIAAAVGVVGCAAPVVEESGAIAQAADGSQIFQTLSMAGSITGAVNKSPNGDEHRVRIYYDAESVLVKATGSDAIIAREWAISQTDYETNGKRDFSLMMLVEPVARMAILRGFAGKSELTCTVDFSHMKATGYGIVTRDWRPSGKSEDFQTAKWSASSPKAPLGCDFEEQLGVGKVLKRWAPLYAHYAPKWDAKVRAATERANVLGMAPGTTYKSAAFDFGPATVTPQDLFQKLTDNERLILERALVLAIAGGVTGAVGGAAGGPGGIILGAALGAASAYTAAVWAGYFEEKKRLHDEQKARDNAAGRGPTTDRGGREQNGGDEPGRYGPPVPADVGWDGHTGGQTRGGDETGMSAGDIPPNNGAGTGQDGNRTYPGGSGPGGSGSGTGCTGTGGVTGIGSTRDSTRVMMWCP